VQPQDIDQLRIGQAAVMRFSNFNTRTTPEVNGEITLVSADVTQDQRTWSQLLHRAHRGAAGRAARARQSTKLHARHAGRGFIQTTVRTVVSYFVRPFQDQIAKAFREK
jgi:HlyD family secretion protein